MTLLIEFLYDVGYLHVAEKFENTIRPNNDERVIRLNFVLSDLWFGNHTYGVHLIVTNGSRHGKPRNIL